MPALVITTSGTAVANLHPAVLEAHHSGVPLILLTADRPPELRGIGANQATDQLGIFGPAVRFVRDVEAPAGSGFSPEYPGELAREAVSAALGHSSAPGPVQLNLALRAPLSAPVTALPAVSERRMPVKPARTRTAQLGAADGTIVIAGHDAGAGAEDLARATGSPLLAEVSSGARFGPNLVARYRELLGDERFGGAVRRAVVFGHPTLSREVPALLERDDVETIVVRGHSAEDYNPGRRAARIVDALDYAGPPQERSWAGSWVAESRRIQEAEADAATPAEAPGRRSGFSREQLAAFRQPVTRQMLVDAIWRSTWPHDRLVLAASRLIRELDARAPGKRITVHANRGLAGIDGTIATAIGIALAAEADGSTGTTRVLIGDLALLHDVGAMLFGSGELRPRLQVIVGNDGGGTIFDGLEVAASAPPDAFDRVMYTSQAVDLAAIAAAYGWQYRAVRNRGELDEAISASSGTTLIEVPLPR